MAGYSWSDLSVSAQNKATQIYQWLLSYYGSAAGVSAIMGNMWIESAATFDGRICENYNESDLDTYCEQYTEDVDDGIITRSQFENAGWGYGLMQWTWSSRRVGLYDFCFNNGYTSIGYSGMQVDYIYYEMTTDSSYATSYNAAINATEDNIDQTTQTIMTNYLRPDPGSANLPGRQEASRSIYNALSGLPPIPPGPPVPSIDDILFLKHFINRNYKVKRSII